MNENSILIGNRYRLYNDGIIYDTEKAGDIPQWIFEFRDFMITAENERIKSEFLAKAKKELDSFIIGIDDFVGIIRS